MYSLMFSFLHVPFHGFLQCSILFSSERLAMYLLLKSFLKRLFNGGERWMKVNYKRAIIVRYS